MTKRNNRLGFLSDKEWIDSVNGLSADQKLSMIMGRLRWDPLAYVMFIFPWQDNPDIQMVELPEKYREAFPGFKYGPDLWACDFLEELGGEIAKRKFDGRNAVEPIRFATASGHGIGKSTLVAWLIKFILDTRPYSKGVVTANTGEQLRTKTWSELSKWNTMSLTHHLWSYTSGRGSLSIYRSDKDLGPIWRCDAQTCKEENSEAFQGLHAARGTPFYIFDEASGIPDKIFEARSGGATDGEPMWFDFGNPTRNSGWFYEEVVGKLRHRYITRSIDSRDVAITNKALMQEWIDDFGVESDYVKVKVRGVFPSQGSVQFIPTEYVEEAMLRPAFNDDSSQLLIGVDVARFGDDSTVIYPRLGYDARSHSFKEYKGLDNVQVAEKVVEMVKYFSDLGKKPAGIFVDGGGLGAGVVDILRRLGYNPIDVQFGGKPADPKYKIKSDEMWGRLREALPKMMLPRNPKLKDQLIQREFGFTDTGKMSLERKKDMKDRGLDSPDTADALALTFHSHVSPELNMGIVSSQQLFAKHDYDPLEID